MLLKPLFNPTAYNHLHPLSRGLVVLYPFWEGNGNKLEDVANKHSHGSLTNDTFWNGSKLGWCLDLDGIGDNVTLPASFNDSMNGLTQWTVTSLFMPRAVGAGNDSPFFGQNTVSTHPTIRSRAGNVYQCLAGDGAGLFIAFNTTATFVNNVWYYFAFSYDGDRAKSYVDGVLDVDNNAVDAKMLSTGDVSVIGGAGSATAQFDGKIALTSVYDRALSSKEIKDLSFNPWIMFEV